MGKIKKYSTPLGSWGIGDMHTPGCASLTRDYCYLSPAGLWNSAVLNSVGTAHPTGLIRNSPLKKLSGLC